LVWIKLYPHTSDLVRGLNRHFQSKLAIPRMRMGDKQEIETLISEEALLLAKYLRKEKREWIPRIIDIMVNWN